MALTRCTEALKGSTVKKELKKFDTTKPLSSDDYRLILKNSQQQDSESSSKASKSLQKERLELDKDVRSSGLLFTSDISFLKKEVVYTKLKYSRSPQYDAVSGGFAALFAGFIGFLISEKFGIELVDSGDFFIGLMYIIFIGFTGRLLLITSSNTSSPRFSVSPLHNLAFFKEITLFALRKLSLLG